MYEGDARASRPLMEIAFNALEHLAVTERPDRKKQPYIPGAIDLDDPLRHQITQSRER